MCDTENLIDLSECGKPKKDHIREEEKENHLVVTNCFKEPYDPFDFVENEAYNKVSSYMYIHMYASMLIMDSSLRRISQSLR